MASSSTFTMDTLTPPSVKSPPPPSHAEDDERRLEPQPVSQASTSSPPALPKQRQRRGGIAKAGTGGVVDAAAAGRGKRMFGILNATLGKAKKEAEDRVAMDKRRADIVSRQHQRLERQRTVLIEEERLRKSLRHEYEEELKLLEALMSGEAAFKSMRAQKRRLASFLVTSSPTSAIKRTSGGGSRGSGRRDDPASLAGGSSATVAPHVPSSLHPSSRSYPLYYLPKKLTIEQEDMLDDQEDEVDALIDEAEKQWEERRKRLLEQLEEVRTRVKEMKQSGANGEVTDLADEKPVAVAREGAAEGTVDDRRDRESRSRSRGSDNPQDEKMHVDTRQAD